LPFDDQMRACPSYEPVASADPLWFQSSVVTSLLFSLSEERCWRTAGSAIAAACPLPQVPFGTRQILAVDPPEPEASSSEVGDQAQMKTSLVWPCNVVTASSGVSLTPSAEDEWSPLPDDAGAGASVCCFFAGGPLSDDGPPPLPSALRSSEKGSVDGASLPSSPTLRSSSVYMMPF